MFSVYNLSFIISSAYYEACPSVKCQYSGLYGPRHKGLDSESVSKPLPLQSTPNHPVSFRDGRQKRDCYPKHLLALFHLFIFYFCRFQHLQTLFEINGKHLSIQPSVSTAFDKRNPFLLSSRFYPMINQDINAT